MEVILRDFSSIKVINGADQMGPCKKPTRESNTQALSSFASILGFQQNARLFCTELYFACNTGCYGDREANTRKKVVVDFCSHRSMNNNLCTKLLYLTAFIKQ